MARFKATLKGSRGAASRLGGKKAGARATVNGWHAGVHVEAEADPATERDVFYVYVTGGSHGAIGERIAVIREGADGNPRVST